MLYNILNLWNFFNEESHYGEPDYAFSFTLYIKSKGKVFPLQARCGPEGGYRYSSTLP